MLIGTDENMTYRDFKFKIVVIGDKGIGKTAFITRCQQDTFEESDVRFDFVSLIRRDISTSRRW